MYHIQDLAQEKYLPTYSVQADQNMGLFLQSDLSTELDQFALVKILIKIAGAATWKFTKGQLQKIKYLFSYYRHPLISGVLISAIFNLFSSSLVLESNLDIHGFLFPFFLYLHINRVNRGMPVFWHIFYTHCESLPCLLKPFCFIALLIIVHGGRG